MTGFAQNWRGIRLIGLICLILMGALAVKPDTALAQNGYGAVNTPSGAGVRVDLSALDGLGEKTVAEPASQQSWQGRQRLIYPAAGLGIVGAQPPPRRAVTGSLSALSLPRSMLEPQNTRLPPRVTLRPQLPPPIPEPPPADTTPKAGPVTPAFVRPQVTTPPAPVALTMPEAPAIPTATAAPDATVAKSAVAPAPASVPATGITAPPPESELAALIAPPGESDGDQGSDNDPAGTILTRIIFADGLQQLPADADAALNDLATAMRARPELAIRILGYAGDAGDDGNRQRRLALFRALAVRTYLAGKDIPIRRMEVRGMGEVPDGDAIGRVDIVDIVSAVE